MLEPKTLNYIEVGDLPGHIQDVLQEYFDSPADGTMVRLYADACHSRDKRLKSAANFVFDNWPGDHVYPNDSLAIWWRW